MLSFLHMAIKKKKSIHRELNLIHDEIQNKKIIHLSRIRESDLAKHEFIFQRHNKTVDPYVLMERYEGDTVLEDYHDHDTVIILCQWLLQLDFRLQIYKPGDYPKETIQ